MRPRWNSGRGRILTLVPIAVVIWTALSLFFMFLLALDSIAAVVIGGTAFVGGIGGVAGTMAGAFIIKLLTLLLRKINISHAA